MARISGFRPASPGGRRARVREAGSSCDVGGIPLGAGRGPRAGGNCGGGPAALARSLAKQGHAGEAVRQYRALLLDGSDATLFLLTMHPCITGYRSRLAGLAPSAEPVRNPGLGLVGYTWEEAGPSLAARAGRETLERHVEQMAGLPFVDVLYIRCDWRDVQSQPGRLDLHPVWPLTLDAARRHGLRVAFRVRLSNTVFQPKRLAMPDFVHERVPLVKIGRQFTEPRYDHPAFLSALEDLNDLLAARFEGDPAPGLGGPGRPERGRLRLK